MSEPPRRGSRRIRETARDLLVRRQSDTARTYQDAYLHDIYSRWEPGNSRDVWYDRLSRLTHLGIRLFSGGPTLAPIAAAALPTLIGNAFFAAQADSVPKDASLSPGSPSVVFLVIALGLVGLMAEVIRSPRAIQLRRFSLVGAVPLGIGVVLDAILERGTSVDDAVLRAGLLCVGLALVAVPVAGLTGPRAPRVVIALLRGAALGCLVIALTQAYWAVRYAEAGYLLIAAGQVLVTLGGLMFTSAFARARPHVELTSPTGHTRVRAGHEAS